MATATDISTSAMLPTFEVDLGESNNFGAEAVTLDFPTLEEIDPTGGVVGPTTYFKMRALANPGPGYLTWGATGVADFAGTGAPGAIQVGTAVVVVTWQE